MSLLTSQRINYDKFNEKTKAGGFFVKQGCFILNAICVRGSLT